MIVYTGFVLPQFDNLSRIYFDNEKEINYKGSGDHDSTGTGPPQLAENLSNEVLTAFGMKMKIQFPDDFAWNKGGYLPGIHGVPYILILEQHQPEHREYSNVNGDGTLKVNLILV